MFRQSELRSGREFFRPGLAVSNFHREFTAHLSDESITRERGVPELNRMRPFASVLLIRPTFELRVKDGSVHFRIRDWNVLDPAGAC